MAEYVDRYDVGSLESTERQYTDLDIIKRIISQYIFRHRSLFILDIALIFVKLLTVLAGPFILKVSLDFFIMGTPTQDGEWLASIIHSIARMYNPSPDTPSLLLASGLLFTFISLSQWWIGSFQQYFTEKLGTMVIADIRLDFFNHINNLSQRFFEYGNTGRLVSRVTNDAEALKKILNTGVIGLTADLLLGVSVLAVMAYLNLQLTVVALLIAPILALTSRLFQQWIKTAWSTARRNVASLTSKVQDLMYGAKVTKALTQEERSLREFDEVNEQNMQSQIRAETVSVTFSSIVILLSSIMTAAIWYLGGQRVILGAQTLGQLVAFNQYASWFFEPIQNLAMLYGAIQSAITGAERIFVVMDQEPEVIEETEAIEVTDLRGEIEFRDVNFSYVEGQPVLKNINLKTAPGEKLAIFGPTGSGKSTIINLLGRFYDPSDGAVFIDGYDVKELSFSSLRKAVSIVLQEPFLFSGTIEYNLKFGRPEAGDDEMIRVARLVGIHDVIAQLRDGYQTVILERGSNLSFGQRQLICLARAILADPRILVFDEATSSVDPYTEAKIQETLQREMENRTVIVVTHRVSTVRDSDRIIILQEGEVEDDGTHEQLLERNELYRRLCEMQLVSV